MFGSKVCAQDPGASVPTPAPSPAGAPSEGAEAEATSTPEAEKTPQVETYPAAPFYPQSAPTAEPEGYYGTYPPPPMSPPEDPYGAERRRRRGPGAREHEGFFLRMTLGLGAGVMGYDEAVDGRRVSHVKTRGLAALFGVSVGGRVVENLLLHGDLLVASTGDARKEIDGTPNATDRIDGTFALLGGGLTYYFMPVNAYASVIAGVCGMNEVRDSEASLAIRSDLGFGGSLMVGKEWWVGRAGEWGLGAALRSSFYTAPVIIANDRTRMRGADIGLAFSATFN